VALSDAGLAKLPEGLQNELIVRFLGHGGIEPSRILVDSVRRLLGSSTGRWIKAGTTGQRIYRDRDSLILVKRPARPVRRMAVRPGTTVAIGNGRLRISSPRPIPRSLHTAPDVAWVDEAALSGRLELRRWRAADRIIPFGMASRKKVSDLLTDQKVPAHRKKGIPVVTSGGRIVWVCGVRIDDRYRVTTHTKRVLQFTYHISV
jgi:tRNA(Ile)-lysidine synthase